MTLLTEILIVTAKVVFVSLLFCMPIAVLLTWADRRQGAMIQDRVGPNRAAIFMPGKLAAVLVALPAFAVAGGALAWAWFNKLEGETNQFVGFLFIQLALATIWITLVAIAGRVRVRGITNSFDRFVLIFGDPRSILGWGLLLHAVTISAFFIFYGSNEAKVISEIGASSGPAVFAAAVLGGALYAAAQCAQAPQVGLRLAGILHAAADGLKTIFKEDVVPDTADHFVHSLAPLIAFFPVLVVMAVVPFGASLCIAPQSWLSDLLSAAPKTCSATTIKLQILDVDVGLLFYFALGGTGIIGAALAGWASNDKFSLLGGLRAASQMVSYEVTMGLTLIGALMIYGTLRIDQMVAWQGEHAWGIFVQPLAFVLFMAAAIAEAKRVPFDLPEGESEIVAGYFTEYSGMKFAMFFFAEYVTVLTASALMTSMFLGGWQLPFIDQQGIRIAMGETVYWQLALPQVVIVLISIAAFVGKTLFLCWLQLLIRWTVPRFRYDQLMKLGWRILLPASIVNIFVTGIIVQLIEVTQIGSSAALKWIADLTQVVIAAGGLWATVALTLELLRPAQHRRLTLTSAAHFVEQMGGLRTRRMGA
jgi:NADH-quinone oxidoreductase subunit H